MKRVLGYATRQSVGLARLKVEFEALVDLLKALDGNVSLPGLFEIKQDKAPTFNVAPRVPSPYKNVYPHPEGVLDRPVGKLSRYVL